MVWMRTVITYLEDGQSTREQSERGRENRKWDKQVKKEKKKKQNRSKRRKKKTKIKQIQERKHKLWKQTESEMHSVTLSHAFEQISSFHSSCYIYFFFHSWSLRLSQTCCPCKSNVSLHYQVSLVCQPRESITAQTRRRSKKEKNRRERKANEKWLFFNSPRLRSLLGWHGRQRVYTANICAAQSSTACSALILV